MKAFGFLGSNTPTEYTVKKDGVDYDLAANGVVRVEVVDEGQVLSSDTDAVNMSGNTLTIDWGQFNLPPGNDYVPTIYAYQAGDEEGEVLFGPSKSPIYLTLVEDERPAS